MKKIILFFFCIYILSNDVKAQIENVIVETYYVSDANDATDTTGGYLSEGSTTYRIYVDLAAGSVLRKVYGSPNHPLKITSTENFFNHKMDGQSFGKDISKNRLDEGTVALDSWLTLGQVTRIGSKTYFGVPKNDDGDGSFIGGANNDGGSASIPGGLLINAHLMAGVALTTSDGYDTMMTVPSNWITYGITDAATNADSTIFGSLVQGNYFISENVGLMNSGITGVDPLNNVVLLAQLTTKGELSFELNLVVEEMDGVNTKTVYYVADGSYLSTDSTEKISPFLKYPRACGCTDPSYLEYNPGYACYSFDSCRTLIRLGCMDSIACNFDPEANFNIQEICCYPGYCNDRDISVVCPELGIERIRPEGFEIFPNPAKESITIRTDEAIESIVEVSIIDYSGKLISREKIKLNKGITENKIDISSLENGLYLLRLLSEGKSKTYYIIKN